MKVNVAQLLKSPIGTVRDYQLGETVDIAGNDSPVQGDVRLLRTDRGILVWGIMAADIELTCSRCLSQFRCPVKMNIEEEYFPTINVVSGMAIPLPDDPGSFTVNEQNILDLTEAIRQYVLLAIPMKPLCREDCAGLCPTCGCNLNQLSCNCLTKPVDPRWAVLSRLALRDNHVSGNEQKGTE
jgi:uncharacterized protein